MVNTSAKTSDILIKKIKSETLKKAEQELIEIYGQRYLDYRRLWKLSGELKYEPEFPLYIMLEQSFRCNMRCVSCIQGYPHLQKKFSFKEKQMPWELFEKIILEGEKNNCPSIAMHNNDEPLLVKDLEKRIAFAKRHGFMDIIVTTNGINLSDRKIKAIIDAGITRMLFSIDAATEETYNKVRPQGDFKKVLLALKKVKEYRDIIQSPLPILRTSFVVTRINQHELSEFLNKFSNFVDYIDVQPFMKYYDANRHLIPSGSKLITDFYCNGPWRTMIVRGNGDVLPCPNFYGAELIMGNVYDKTLKEIFNSNSMKQLRQDFKEGYYRHTACKECSTSIYEIKI